MSYVYYHSITNQPHAYPYYSAQNVFVAKKGVSPYFVASDLTYQYYKAKPAPNISVKYKTKKSENYLQWPMSPCDGRYRDMVNYFHLNSRS